MDEEQANIDEYVYEKRDRLPPAPDGGLVAWLQVLASHLTMASSWGFTNSFGIFQGYLVHSLNKSSSEISWIGSVQLFFMFFVSMFAGRAADAGYTRPLVACGFALQLLGVFTASAAKTYWQVMLSQSVCQGIGCGLYFCPMVALVVSYFEKKRVVAIAIQASGTATGGLIFPAIAERLISRAGYGWALRSMAFVMLFNAVVVVSLIRPRLPPRRDGAILEPSAFLELPYLLFAIALFFTFWGSYVGFFYIRPYAVDIQNASQDASFQLLLVLNGVGYFGRILPAMIAQKIGPVNMFVPLTLISAVLLFCWIGVSSLTGTWVFTGFYGFFGAGVQGIFPAASAALADNAHKLGVRVGMLFSVVGFSALTSTPIAGALVSRDNGSYLYAQLYGGVALMLGTAFTIAARTAKHGVTLRKAM